MTLDGYALTGLFVVMFGFLCLTAYIFERAEPDPISGDRRSQAHPFDGLSPATRSGPERVEVAPRRQVASVTTQGRSGSPVVDPPPESAAAG